METSQEMLNNQWHRICSQIQRSESSRFAARWLSKLVLDKIEGNTVRLLVHSTCIHELIKEKYADKILTLWKQENANISELDLKLVQNQTELPLSSPAVLKPLRNEAIISSFGESEENDVPRSLLNPSYTFKSFVVGQSNKFACAAAHKVAEEEDVSEGSNPLYIHSGVGLGKTHLLHAIAWRMRELYPTKNILYLSSEQFLLRFIRAMRQDKNNRFEGTERFRDIFRSVDVLIIDDIQFICNKKATQEEFYNTFNDLIAHGKQIILSADSPVQNLKEATDRLKTRLAQGLVVEIEPTSYELRRGILEAKTKSIAMPVPADVLDFLAKNITSNIRELEGALKRIVAHAELIGDPINIETTRVVLQDLLRVSIKEINLKEIQYAVCAHYQIGLTDLKSTRRDRKVTRPRQLAMYLAKTLTPLSLPDIGRGFERDHTTVMHAVSTIENLITRDKSLSADADILIRRLKGENI